MNADSNHDNTDNTSSDARADSNAGQHCRNGFSGRARLVIGAGLLLAIGAIGGGALMFVGQAYAHGFGGHHAWKHGHGSSPTLEQVQESAQRRTRWLAAMVDATPEQEERLGELSGQLMSELYPLMEKHRANKQTLFALLLAGETRRDDLESLRYAELALADEASARVLDALFGFSQSLSQQQRQDLVLKLERVHRD